MTKYILHGGFTSAENKLNKTFYREITGDLSDGSNVLLIYFARDPEEWDRLFAQDRDKILETTECMNLEINYASRENFTNEVQKADVLYIRGGDTQKLLNILGEYPSFVEIIDGKVLAGSSAGAYVWSTYHHSASTGKISKSLGLLPIRIICHYESDEFPKANQEAIKRMREYSTDLELVVLRDYEWKVFEQ